MTHIHRKAALILILSTFVGLTPSHSRTREKIFLPYAYGHTIDFSVGPAFSFNNSYPNSGYGLSSDGADILLRYSYFFGKHFGAYASFFTTNTSPDFDKYMGSLGKDFIYTGDDYINELYTGVTAGCVYRYDFGRWSLRPRVGIGYCSYDGGSWSYYKFSKDKPDKDPEHIILRTTNGGTNVLKNCFAIEAGLQMTFSVASHFFFSAEIGTRIIPGSCTLREDVFKTRTKTPETWKEALSETYKDIHMNTERISERDIKNPIGDILSVKFGIGWNIGFNRNVNR